MAETLVLLPGWGLGPAALEPLARALRASRLHANVRIQPLPECSEPDQALQALDHVIEAGAWLLGWSLGGMLAMALAARRGPACPGVVTFASNACFVAREGWPAAMASETFTAFAGQCAADPAGTLKRFGLLCVQGSQGGRALLKGLPTDPGHADPQGLGLLAALDNRAALATPGLAQLHVFASADALVPAQAASSLARLAPHACVEEIDGSHACVLEMPEALALRVSSFIEETGHD